MGPESRFVLGCWPQLLATMISTPAARPARTNLWGIKPSEKRPSEQPARGTPTIAESLPELSSCEYWRRRFAGRDMEIHLPFCQVDRRIASTVLLTPAVEIAPETAERVRTFARGELTTPFSVMLAAWQVALARHSRQPEFVVGCGLPGGSTTVQERPMIVHATVPPQGCFRDLVRTVAMRRAEGAAHGNVPVAAIARAFGEQTSPGRHPLFQVAFVQRNSLGESAALSLDNKHTHPVDLACVWEDNGRSMRVRLEYPAGVIAPDVAARLPAHIANLVRAGVSLPEAPVSTLPMLTAAEYLEKARL